jgi:hypothetical protein
MEQRFVSASIVGSETSSIALFATSSYSGFLAGYMLRVTGSGASRRVGNINSVWSGSLVNNTETTTVDIGDTSGVVLNVVFSGQNAVLQAENASTEAYQIKATITSL